MEFFKKLKSLLPRGIKRRITFTISSAILVVVMIGISFGYFIGFNILHDVVGNNYTQEAELLGDYIDESLKGEIEDAKSYATRASWLDTVAEVNLKYSQMNKEDIARYMSEMDKAWVSTGNKSPLLIEYTENRISVGMREIVKIRGNIAELFITDRYGALVASSGKTSDFYQADEDWWKAAYNVGKGDIYVGDMEYDESSNFWVIPIAVPMTNKSNEVMGVLKYSISMMRLFGRLSFFKIGQTGHVILSDSKGNVLYHPKLSPMKTSIYSADELHRLLLNKKKYMAVNNKRLHEIKAFIAFSKIKPPHLYEKGVEWIIFVVQDASEAYAPLNKLIVYLAILAVLLFVLTLPIGYFFGSLIAKPIHELHMATEKVMNGNWDYRIEVHTGDEIEQFAHTFRDMIANIKDKQMRLESFSRGLEEKVKERTKELTEAKEATLNILEDLEEAKENLERSNKQLKQLDQLKSGFISTVSHELRTPLSIIKEGVSLVLDKVPGDINEKQARILDISKFNIDRLSRIIDGLLDISKIEAGKVELKKSLINISDIAKQIADLFEIKAKEKRLELKLDIDKDAGKVYADPDRISQVFINIINNAIKFTTCGYVEVSCRDRKDAVVCSVKDTGIGISKSDLPKLFDKFQQFGRLVGAGEKGTGLGLSIAKSIIDMHSGYISVESEPGIGSCFTFSLHKYTEQSLFTEFTNKAIKRAAQTRSKLSIIIISSKWKEGLGDVMSVKDFHNAMSDCARLIKNTLRRQGDELVSNKGDMLVILIDCSKNHSVLVRDRLEQILNKSLEEKKMRDKLDMQYGYATFPDDGKTEAELVCKARSYICTGQSNKA